MSTLQAIGGPVTPEIVKTSNGAAAAGPQAAAGDGPLRAAFDAFVGQTFYSQLLSAMRDTVGKPAYFHGGRAEEVFQAQMDQILAERMAEASSAEFTGPMFDLFTLPRS